MALLQGDYEPGSSDWANQQVADYEASHGERANTLRGVPVVIITSVGRGSGKLRKNPVMRVEHDGEYAAVASKGGTPEQPAWYHNISAHPVVDLQDGPEPHAYAAREVTGEERQTWWDRAVAVWPDYADYQRKTERQIPVFVLTRTD